MVSISSVFFASEAKKVGHIQLVEKSTYKYESTPRRACRARFPAKLFSGSGTGQARLRTPMFLQTIRAPAYACGALPRERKRAFHKMSSNTPSAHPRDLVAGARYGEATGASSPSSPSSLAGRKRCAAKSAASGVPFWPKQPPRPHARNEKKPTGADGTVRLEPGGAGG